MHSLSSSNMTARIYRHIGYCRFVYQEFKGFFKSGARLYSDSIRSASSRLLKSYAPSIHE